MIELYNGDCLDIMKNIPNDSIDMILCDLPYGTTACKWDIVVPLEPLWEQYNRIISNHGVICLFGQEPFSSIVRTSNLSMYRYDWIWQKQKPSNFQLMNYQPGRVQENIMVFSKAKSCYVKNGNTANYFPQKERRESIRHANAKIYGENAALLHDYSKAGKDNFKTYTDKHPTSIIKFNTVQHKLHPTEKPIDLLEYLIKTYTKENNIVLDNCMGGGSTGVACKNLSRNFIGIELDRDYFEIAKKRIDE